MFGEGFLWAAFDFRGRISRSKALYAYLSVFAICGIIAIMLGMIIRSLINPSVAPGMFQGFLYSLMAMLFIPVIWASLAIATKRLHDIGYSGWWSVITLVPYISWLPWLVLMIVPGVAGENQYGRKTNSAS